MRTNYAAGTSALSFFAQAAEWAPMKPPAFEYARPATVQEALQLLRDLGEDAKLLAGGQSLVPALNFRLLAPRLLIDVNELMGLNYISGSPTGLRLGALTRWYQVETASVVGAKNPLLKEAVRHVAHYQIRNRGTVGGSCAHADPAAELPAVLIACGGEVELESATGGRAVPAEQFFVGALETVLEPDEMIVALQFPAWPPRRRWAFEEFARRKGDFAIVGAIALIDEDDAETCTEARLVVFGAGDKAMRLRRSERVLQGRKLTSNVISAAATEATKEIDARSDIHATAEYRTALTGSLLKRCLGRAAGVSDFEAI
jgi:carbon-monoxide dehydrogenase medium subunit